MTEYECNWCGETVQEDDAILWDMKEADIDLDDDGEVTYYEETGYVQRHAFCREKHYDLFGEWVAYPDKREDMNEPHDDEPVDWLPEEEP